MPPGEPVRHRYGPHPSQYAELLLPRHREHAVVAVIIHGGFWRQDYGAELGRPLAADLAARGIAIWNLEYRRTAGGDGGYPQTFADIAAGIDALDEALDVAGLQPGPRVAVGHSAGGHLALWAAGRGSLPPGVPGALPAGSRCLDAVVSQAGVLDLGMARELGLSHDAAGELMGTGPQQDPVAWSNADPAARAALPVPLVMLHGRGDADVPVALARSFAARARATGPQPDYREFDGDHYGLITPGDPAWEASVAALLELGAAAQAVRPPGR